MFLYYSCSQSATTEPTSVALDSTDTIERKASIEPNITQRRKLTILLHRGHFDPKFQVEGMSPANNFCTVSYANDRMPYNFVGVADSFHTKKLADFLQAKWDIYTKNSRFALLSAPWGT